MTKVKFNSCEIQRNIREVSFVTRNGGAPENWGGGSGTLSKIKRGIKRFFKLKRGDHLYFLKK